MAPDAHVGGRRAIADIAVQVLARGGNLILGIVVTLILVRTLGDDDFGRWTTLLSVTQLAVVFTELGLEPAVVNQAARDPDRESSWVGALVALRLLLAIPVTIISIVVCLILADNGDMALAGVLLSCTMLASAPSALRAFNQLRVRNDVTMIVLTANSLLWGAAVIALAITGGSLAAYGAAFLAVTATTATLQAILSRPQMRQRLRIARELWRTVLQTGLPLGAAGVIIAMSAKAPQIFVFEISGPRDAGLYGAASRLFEQSHFIPMAVMTTLLPIMSIAQRADPAQARRVLQLSLDYLLLAALPFFALTVVASPQLLQLLFGDEFVAAAPALPVLMAAFVFVALNYPLDNMVIVQGQQRQLIKIALAGLTVMVIGNAIGVPAAGFEGAAWAVLAAEIVVTVLTYRLVSGPLGMTIGQGRLLRIVASAAVALVALEALDIAGAPLGVLVAALAVAYPAALIVLGGLDLGELRAIMRRRPPADLAPEPAPPAPGP